MIKDSPVQIVFEILEHLSKEKIIDYTTKMLLTEELDDLLELEKEYLIQAYEAGQRNTANGFYIKAGEKYYNDNFKKQENGNSIN